MTSTIEKYEIYFDKVNVFSIKNFKPLIGMRGLYFICLGKTQIPYPFKKSRLIYIGMSEKRTNSVGQRLRDHYDGNSKNMGLLNYRKAENLFFTVMNFESVKNIWSYRIEDLESYFILDFLKHYGIYPICNNKSTFEIKQIELPISFVIDWKCFE